MDIKARKKNTSLHL